MSKATDDAVEALGFRGTCVVLAVAVTICAWLWDYSLWALVGMSLPWYLDACLAFVFKGKSVPVWVFCWLWVHQAEYATPIIHQWW